MDMTMASYEEWKRYYYTQKESIMKDDSLNELEKVNKVRALAGIEPLTMEQFLEQQKLK